MEYGALLTDSKWDIIKELSIKEQTPTDLAAKASTSLANISQQLRLLEAYRLVKKEKKVQNKQPGKPRTVYSIDKEINYVIAVSDNYAVKKELELDYFQKAIFNMCVAGSNENIYFIEKFFITNEEVVKKCDAVGLVREDESKIELLLITKHIQSIREKYSNQSVENLEGKKKTIVCWTHNMDEMEEGLKTKNEHFLNLTKNLFPIIEKDLLIKKILEIKNEKST
ncbi:ArsR/SmtB family transcription factor [Bacteroidota bacterium]